MKEKTSLRKIESRSRDQVTYREGTAIDRNTRLNPKN